MLVGIMSAGSVFAETWNGMKDLFITGGGYIW